MEKLIELLNEYSPDYCKDYPDDIIMDEIVISKRFGFIKRLVDNDKIKYNKVPEHIYVSDYSFETIHKGMTDNILMWLAIQDNPIDVLISILK